MKNRNNRISGIQRKNGMVYIASLIVGLLTSGALLLLFAAMVYILQLPVAWSETLALISFGAGCLFAAMFSGKKLRKGGLISGLKTGAMMFIIVLIGSLFTQNFSGSFLIDRIISAVICGSVGGVIGVNRTDRYGTY